MTARVLSRTAWRRRDGARMVSTVTAVETGIRSTMAADGHEVWSLVSARPYRLGQACDGTIDTCVTALFLVWCYAHDHDPATLVLRAYGETRHEWSVARQLKTLREAFAEGVVVPPVWCAASVRGLLDSLHEINCHALAEVVSDLADTVP